MNSMAASIYDQFQDALSACKELYIAAAHAQLARRTDGPGTDRHDTIRRFVDLHKGLLVKIYATVANADRRWSGEERVLARLLVKHLWQEQLETAALRAALARMIRDADKLEWRGLLGVFSEWPELRDLVAQLDTLAMRIGNMVAKVDGQIAPAEAEALRAMQQEIDTVLRRPPLPSDERADAARRHATSATQLALATAETSGSGGTTAASEPDRTEADQRPTLAEALAELEKLIGLDKVKDGVRSLANFLKLQHRRKEAGLPGQDLSLHMIFMGNPGTGKTTVSRIVGRIFQALGLLAKGHLVETDRAGLVAEYAGQTGPKTHRKIDEALDGVLFIDEAYSLVADGPEDPYGQEAVQALIKRMEDDRDRLVVVLAGYPEPMRRLLGKNPGISSRFNTKICFDDYSPVDLGRIFDHMCHVNQYELTAPARVRLALGFQWLFDRRDEQFGNGRLVRNVFEDSIRSLANRIADIVPVTRELLTVLAVDDIQMDGVPDSVWQPLADGRVQFRVTCPNCSQSIKLKPRRLGKEIACPRCRQKFMAAWGTPKIVATS